MMILNYKILIDTIFMIIFISSINLFYYSIVFITFIVFNSFIIFIVIINELIEVNELLTMMLA